MYFNSWCVFKSADNCWIKERRTGVCNGHGCLEKSSAGRIFSHKFKTRFKSDADNAYSKAWLNWFKRASFNTCCCLASNVGPVGVTAGDDKVTGAVGGSGVVVLLTAGLVETDCRSKVLNSFFWAVKMSRNIEVVSSRIIDRVVSRTLW